MAQKKQVLPKKDKTIKKTKQQSQSKKLSQAAQKLKPTELKFAKTYATNGNKGKAAVKEVYPQLTDRSAAVRSSDLLRKPEIIEVIQEEEKSLKEALLDAGITPNKIANKVNVLLDAEKKIYRNNMKTGKIEEVGTEPHHEAIDKGLKHATAIFGVADPAMKPSGNTYNFFINPELRKKVDVVEEEIKQSLYESLPKDE